jgi:monomeric isocitrate dehydrogenase
MTQNQKCLHLDEAPLLYSFLPIVQAFTATAGEMETKDILWLPEFYQFRSFK